MKVVAIIQARMGSQRLPGKSLMLIGGIPLLQLVIERVKLAKRVDAVLLATSTEARDDPLCTLAASLGIGVYRGPEDDVLSRFVGAARESGAGVIVRVCADNPLVDPGEIDRLVAYHLETGAGYSFNHVPTRNNRYPDGFGAEAVSIEVLSLLDRESHSPEEREHVTLRARRHPGDFRVSEPVAPPEIMGPDIRLDIDTPADFGRMKGFIGSLPPDRAPSWTAEEIVRRYREYFGSRVIVILDGREDARAYCTLYHGRIAGALPLATSPGAWWELEKRGIPCLPIQDYFDRGEIYRLGMENYRALEAVCGVVDRGLREKVEAVRLHGLEPARYDIFNLKCLLDNLSIRAHLLGKVVEREKPDLLCIVADPDHCRVPDRDPEAFFSDDLNWFLYLLDLGCGMTRFTTLDYRAEGSGVLPARKGARAPHLLRSTVGRVPFLYPILFTHKLFGTRQALRVLPAVVRNWLQGKSPLLLLGYGYDWNRIIPDLTSRGYPVRPFRPEDSGQGGDESPVDLPGKEEAGRLLVSGGIDLSAPVLSYLSLRLQKTLACIPAAVETMGREAGRRGRAPLALLSGPRQEPVDQLYARLAQRHQLPVVTWQHGAYGAHKAPIMLYTEFMNSDVVLLWGAGVKETMEGDPLNTFPSRAMAVGSREIETMALGKRPQPGNGEILYVTTGYYSNRLYVSYEEPFHDNLLWETQKAIIDALGNRGDTVLKLNPGATCVEHFHEFIGARGYDRIQVIQGERTLPELLGEADTVIIDFPHTSLLQAIAAGKTIFVLTRHTLLSEEAMALLRKRAYCTGDLREFTGMIQAHLEGGPVPGNPDRENTEFLERYGVYRLDGGVAGRAVGVIDGLRQAREGPRRSG